jgi:type IV fimbrial biogenesis protein FimT
MVETLGVVAIIGAMAALASPLFFRQMQDSRVTRLGMMIAETYRLARTRALGRGAATMVRFNALGGATSKGLLETREAVDPTNLSTPTPSCLTTVWTNGAPQSRAIDSLDFGDSNYSSAVTSFYSDTTTAAPYSEICFTPRGKTWMRTAAGNAFTPVAQVPRFELLNNYVTVPKSPGQIRRSVFIPPNGVAMLAVGTY